MQKKPRKSSSTGKYTLARTILAEVLAQVPFDGWTETSYAAALKRADCSRAEADKIFAAGLRDIVEFFAKTTDDAMQKRIAAERGFARMRVRDKITFAIRARLEHMAPHREAVRRLMVWYAMPPHLPQGISRVAKTVDLIWIAAGDISTDYNFYTKRFLLAAVLKATLLFWLSDDTPDSTATWEFLDRRIGDVMKLGKGISLLKEFSPSELADLVRNKVKNAI